MTDRMLTKSKYEIQYFVFSPDDDNPTPRPLQISAKDFGYEIDELELPISFPTPDPSEVDPDNFEIIYQWFLA